jgi:hypothetical protein
MYLLGMVIVASAVGGVVYAFVQGLRALGESRRRKGELARTLRFLALHLCEPLVNTVLISLLLIPTAVLPFKALAAVLITAPKAVLLLPAQGTRFSTPALRDVNYSLVGLGVARWIVAMLTFQLAFHGNILAFLPFLLGIGLLWYSIRWGAKQYNWLQMTPYTAPAQAAGPRPAPAPARAAGMQAARPAGAPSVVSVGSSMGQQAAVSPVSVSTPAFSGDSMPQILCPVCHTSTDLTASGCFSCGLIFRSRVPSSLHTLPDYEVIRPLGDGGMSSVYLAHKPHSSRLCVIKTLSSVESTDHEWRASAARCLKHEYELLRQIDHPNIVRVLYWVSVPHSEFMVLEYVPGLTLEQRLTRSNGHGGTQTGDPLPLSEALGYGVTVAKILDYLVRLPQPVVHHDIKPSNLIVRPDDNRLVLVDFGGAVLLSHIQQETHQPDSYGTPGYAAPEQYNGHSSHKSDVYSLGATLYHLLTDDDPTSHPLSFPKLEHLSPDIAGVLHAALAKDPAERPTARQFHAALRRVSAAYA